VPSSFEKCTMVCYFSGSIETSTQDINLSNPTEKGKEDPLPEPLEESPSNSDNQI